jgi:glyoxylase-like metal-dependent hydrolase (beta-lactamase superfamily II)/rhodanese-related sulfurtransferase
LLSDAASRRCIVVDPLPEVTDRLACQIACQGYTLAAVLDTHSHGDHVSSAPALRAAVPALLREEREVDSLGWPLGAVDIQLGSQRLTRMAVPGHTKDSTAYLLHDEGGLRLAFVGDTVMPGALGRSDFAHSAAIEFAPSLLKLRDAIGMQTLMLPGHDYDDRFACTLAIEAAAQSLLARVMDGRLDAAAFAAAKARLEQDLTPTEYQTMACGARVDGRASADVVPVELAPVTVSELLQTHSSLLVVDVRERYEQTLSPEDGLDGAVRRQATPLSALIDALPAWLALPEGTPLLFICRSGGRSAQAARALRRLGHASSFSLAGGLALRPEP